jgi:hypothetical protein
MIGSPSFRGISDASSDPSGARANVVVDSPHRVGAAVGANLTLILRDSVRGRGERADSSQPALTAVEA